MTTSRLPHSRSDPSHNAINGIPNGWAVNATPCCADADLSLDESARTAFLRCHLRDRAKLVDNPAWKFIPS
jgi:hypothetical protein